MSGMDGGVLGVCMMLAVALVVQQFRLRQADRRWRRRDQLLQVALHARTSFLVILSPDGKVLEAGVPLPQDPNGWLENPPPCVGSAGNKLESKVWWHDLPELQAEFPRRLQRTAESRVPLYFEDPLPSPDGPPRMTRSTLSAVRDALGAVMYLVVHTSEVTPVRQAERELQRATALLRSTQALAGIGGWDVDLMTGHIAWTDEVYRMLEVSRAFSPTIANTRQFCAPESLATLDEALAIFDTQGIPREIELELVSAKGRRFWVRAKTTSATEHGGGTRRTVMLQDITARKKAVADLRASEQLFCQLATHVPGVVYHALVSPQGVPSFRYVSPGVTEMYGVTAEAVYADGLLLHRFRHPDDDERVHNAVKLVNERGERLFIEFRIVLPDGRSKWLQMTSSIVAQDPQGTLRIGMIIDISERKQAEAVARERDEIWKLALESTGDGVWDWNVQANTKTLSRRCLEMYGFTEGEPAVWPILDNRTHPDDMDQMNLDRQAHFDGLTPTYVNEHRIQCKDGSWKWIMSRGMLISRDADGRPLRMIGTHSDITQRKEAERLIWQQANHDALTGLPNLHALRKRLLRDMAQCQARSIELAVLFLDLDHFKEVNDSLGHRVGDALLVDAARRIESLVGEADTVARMGGDEFMVAMPLATGRSRVERVAQAILQSLVHPFHAGQERVHLSASIGIAVYPADGTTIDDLFKHADQAMFDAKATGRNRHAFFTEQMQGAAENRLRLANDLRGALARGELWVAYQPIIDLRSGRVRKAEALVRWQHPVRGAVSPAEFISLAESRGLIAEIGDWVFGEATRQVAQWRHRLAPDFVVSVNMSPAQLQNAEATNACWTAHLCELGLPGDSVVVEITESMLLDAHAQARASLEVLREAGMGISLDDFGTGYSSLSYLHQYDMDYLKIDQSFVQHLSAHSKKMTLCQAIIDMAHALGMTVVAEGVETAEQQALLTAAGCDYGQGYLFARPLTAEAFTAFLMRGPA